jgi:hypothetical protein
MHLLLAGLWIARPTAISTLNRQLGIENCPGMRDSIEWASTGRPWKMALPMRPFIWPRSATRRLPRNQRSGRSPFTPSATSPITRALVAGEREIIPATNNPPIVQLTIPARIA